MISQPLEPPRSERIHSLDVLRGVSLLGILLINMISFHSPFSYYNPYEWWKYDNLVVYTWLDIFVQASFYPIFALMFGYGMGIMWERALLKGVSFMKMSIRRLLALLVIGMIHAFFIWYGDILITYAVMGIVLLLFIRLSGRVLIVIGAALYLLPQLFLSALLLLASLFEEGSLADYADIVSLELSRQIYAGGTFTEIMAQRYSDWMNANGSSAFSLYLIMILPLMMIGAGAAKLHMLEYANERKKTWIIMILVTLPLGLAAKFLPFYTVPSLSIQYIQDILGGPLLGLTYISLIVLLMTNKFIAKLLKPFASAGRMSLTIYLTQSIIGTLIFYSYGLGLYGDVSMATGTWLAVAIFAIQVVIAELWLSKFRYGPMEKVWRLATYGKLMRERREQ